jgi:hypothetical protein
MFYVRCETENKIKQDVYKFLEWFKVNEGRITRGSFYPRLQDSKKRGVCAFNEIAKEADVEFNNGRRCLNFIKKEYDIVDNQLVVEKEDIYKILIDEFKELEFHIEDQPVSRPTENIEFDKLGHIKDMLKEERLAIEESLDIVRWLLSDIQHVYENPDE